MTQPTPDLNSAFALKTPEDLVRLYANWAATYDTDFAARVGYDLPDHVALAFASAGGKGPVLDVGAGTGLVGLRLSALGIAPVDGVDISAEMLVVAGGKRVYRSLIRADLTLGLDLPDGGYAGVTSSGSFTHGHLGSEVLEEVLRVAAPGAIFALSVNAGVWVARGFQAAFVAMGSRIADLTVREAHIYSKPDPEHEGERAQIVVFRKV